MVVNKYLAEFMGTFILIFGGTLAILAVNGPSGAAEIVAIGLGFGLALLAGIWVVGHVSGAHFNPAVTLGLALDGRMSWSDAIGYWVGQFAGATVASLIVWLATDQEAVANTVTGYNALSAGIIVELALTALFVWVIMAVTRSGPNEAPLAISLVLVGIHISGIPFSGASVNPARSFGPAIVGANAGQLWVYLVFPMLGGALAWMLYRLFPYVGERDTLD